MKRKSDRSKYALLLLQRGVPYEEILKDSALKGFSPATLRTLASRMKRRIETNETRERNVETGATANETQKTAQSENDVLNAENDVLTVSKAFQSVSFWREWRDNFHPADLLYYIAVSLAAVGIVNALRLVGYPVAVLFCAGAVIALHGIKTTTGWKQVPHFVIIAVIEAGSFAAHTVWANTALWEAVKDLPLDIWVNKYRNDLGEIVYLYGGNDVQVPGKIALGIASFMLACTVYVCWLAVQNSKKTP